MEKETAIRAAVLLKDLSRAEIALEDLNKNRDFKSVLNLIKEDNKTLSSEEIKNLKGYLISSAFEWLEAQRDEAEARIKAL